MSYVWRTARPFRLSIGGALWYVTARGIERKEIFRDDEDREAFVRILGSEVGRIRALAALVMRHACLSTYAPIGELTGLTNRGARSLVDW